MQKQYDCNVTPQNTRHFKQRRILFIAAMGIFVLNLILSAIFITTRKLWFFAVALVFIAFSIVQFCDKRKDMWTWGYILSWIAFSFIASAVIFLAYKGYWLLIVYAIEIVLYVLLYKKVFKRIKRRPTKTEEV